LENVERHGAYRVLSSELAQHPDKFAGYYRMSKQIFEDLLSSVSPAIEKEDTNYRCAICPAERLLITLRYVNK
jgi:hypothetical protein